MNQCISETTKVEWWQDQRAVKPSPPVEVREQLDTGVLMNCVDEEVARCCNEKETRPASATEQPNRRALLGVLAFAYARQVFESEEIARRCRTETTFRRLCCDNAPFTNELIRFRRRNRPLLEAVLANVLMRATDHAATPQIPAAMKRQMLHQAASRLDTARHMDSGSD